MPDRIFSPTQFLTSKTWILGGVLLCWSIFVEYCSAGVLHIAQPLRLWTFQDGPANHRQDDVCRGPPIITVYPAIRIFNKHQFRFSILFSKLRPTQPPVGVSRSLSRRGAKTGKRSPTMLSRTVNRRSTCDSESILNSFNIFMFCPKLETQTLTFWILTIERMLNFQVLDKDPWGSKVIKRYVLV